ncbi:hypothetical protein ACOSQ2_021315 [Xanthoceras sorbifolium]
METRNKPASNKSRDDGRKIGQLNSKGQGNSSAGRENNRVNGAKPGTKGNIEKTNEGSGVGGSRFQILFDMADDSGVPYSTSRMDKRNREPTSNPKAILKDCTNIHDNSAYSKAMNDTLSGLGSIGRGNQGSKIDNEQGSNFCQENTVTDPNQPVKKTPIGLCVLQPPNPNKVERPFEPPDGDTNMEAAMSDGYECARR